MALISNIQTFIERYAFLPSKEAGLVLSLYVVHSWTPDSAEATPYIYLHSPEKQSGKTRVLETMGMIVKNPLPAASLTDAALFRSIEEFNPTLLLDEVDALFNGAKNESTRAVLNVGYRKDGHVWRIVKGNPERFKTYCCKILSGINNLALPDTIRDRSIPIRMRRKPKSVSVEPFYVRDVKMSDEREKILSGLHTWSEAHGEKLKEVRPKPMEEISDRQWEISEPLVAIAMLMGIETEAREAILKLFQEGAEQEGISDSQQLLIDISKAFKENGMKKISTRVLLEKLGRDWTGKKLANSISCYGIQPKPMRISNEVTKGYELEQFVPVFQSYLDN